MPRSSRTTVDILRQEARAMELLANEIDVPPERLQEYWAISSQLINLVSDIDLFAEENPNAEPDDLDVKELRRRVRVIASELTRLPDEFN